MWSVGMGGGGVSHLGLQMFIPQHWMGTCIDEFCCWVIILKTKKFQTENQKTVKNVNFFHFSHDIPTQKNHNAKKFLVDKVKKISCC